MGETTFGSTLSFDNTVNLIIGRGDSVLAGRVFKSLEHSFTTAPLRATFAKGDFLGSGSLKIEEIVKYDRIAFDDGFSDVI